MAFGTYAGEKHHANMLLALPVLVLAKLARGLHLLCRHASADVCLGSLDDGYLVISEEELVVGRVFRVWRRHLVLAWTSLPNGTDAIHTYAGAGSHEEDEQAG